MLVSRQKFPAKNWKTAFPKEFFNKIWLIIEEHKYIYIAEIKFEKKLFRYDFRGKTNFKFWRQNANLCKLTYEAHGRFEFFSHQNMRNWYLDN